MAEEAVGLAKSLNWVVEWGPSYMNPPKPEDNPDLIDIPSTPPAETHGRDLDLINENRVSVEGERLNNWDKVTVPGTSVKGYYMNGKLLFSMNDSSEDEEDDDEYGDEWSNAQLRQNIAVSSMLRVRNPNSNLFFGTGKVRD